MRHHAVTLRAGVVALFLVTLCGVCAAQPVAPLPDGVRAVWEMDKAHRDTTGTRERVCINGLWRWQPATYAADAVPAGGWGHFKVPGSWPGITDYLQKDCQTVYPHPDWKDQKLGEIRAAWYQREVAVPAEWAGRRIALAADYVYSYATVFVDGKRAGDIRFPGGELDLTAACQPGRRHLLSLHVAAMPLKAVMLAHRDSAAAKEVKGSVARRGLCGDVYLVAAPAGPRVERVRVETSVRRSRIAVDVALEGLAEDGRYALRARITEAGREVKVLTSQPFTRRELAGGRFTIQAEWKPERLWDLHTPGNTYDAHVSLLDSGGGAVLDTSWGERFGFRELWIDGRDFYLNGTRVWLSAVPLDNALVGAAGANYAAARESLERLKSIGINFVYTHNYDCQPGSHLGFEEVLRAADDAGVLVALTQPHFAQYDWKAAGADEQNGYAEHAAFYARVAGNHPSVVFYSTSHNAAGYGEDMNPDLIDGTHEPRDNWSANNAKLASRAEAIIRRLDPSRIVYHHAGGNLGSMYTVNFYANFTPAQEMSDWFGHWATEGVKPLFLCEYAVPFTWDWTMYRGWYRGEREFGSANVPWEFCLAEWNAQFLGDQAFPASDPEKANLRWEAKQFRAGKVWHRWDYPNQVGSPRFAERYPVIADYVTDNWRAFRTWGVSGTSPWEYGHYWRLRPGGNRGRKDLDVDWDRLQRPGFSPDYIDQRPERMDLAFDRDDWSATPAAEALLRNNRPLLAWIAGKSAAFTGKDHNFRAGETVEKQLVVINNSRQTVTCEFTWSLALPNAIGGRKSLTVATGEQARVPLRLDLPESLAPGRYELKAQCQFGNGEVQDDAFPVDVLPAPPTLPAGHGANVALFDPAGQTAAWLDRLGLRYRRAAADDGLANVDILVIGKHALTADGPAPDVVQRVRHGLRVIVFEQTADVLEKRLGFRTAEYGLRRVFPRVPDHPILGGISPQHLADWRGEATTLPPRLKYELRPRYGPTVKWCGIDVTRAWRCGNRGNVASALIEKPARGDFRPVLDGGYSLQYAPLLEYREGNGMVLFCQLDVTARTEPDPAAEAVARNILRYAQDWHMDAPRNAVYAGDPAGLAHLRAAGVNAVAYAGADLIPGDTLIAGPGAGKALAPHAAAVARWLNDGSTLLAIGLDEREANAFLPFRITTKQAEHLSTGFEPPGERSFLAGVGPADVHVREPREVPLVTGGATALGNGVLARAEKANVVFCQLVPWQFADPPTWNVKRTFRRTSYLVTRLLGNMGVAGSTPLLDRFGKPVDPKQPEQRWLDGLYLDRPEEWDDPYRFFRW